MDRIDPDVQRRPFQGRRLGQHQHAALGGAIGGGPRQADLAQDRRQVDHRSAAAPGDGRARMAQSQEHPVQIDRQDATPILQAVGHQVEPAACDPGVVDQHVEPPEPLQRAGDDPLPIRLLADIVGEEGGPTAGAADGLGQRLAVVAREVRQHHGRAFPRQPPCRLGSEPRGRPGHQGDLALNASWPVAHVAAPTVVVDQLMRPTVQPQRSLWP